MTDDQNRRGARNRGSNLRGMSTDTELPVRYVRDRIRETEKVIKTLRSDLSYYRDQNNEMANERNSLLQQISEKGSANKDLSQMENDLRLVESDKDRLLGALGPLESENRKLSDRCARLEADLLDSREKHAEAQEVIVFLESQIKQLESMVEMLRDHNQFMKGE